MRKAFLSLFALSLISGLTACGDDSSNPVKDDNEGKTTPSSDSKTSDIVATFDALPNCSKNREGEKNFVEDEEITYICTSGKWEHFNSIIDSVNSADDLPACQAKLEGDSAYVADKMSYFVCSNKKWTQKEVLMQQYASVDNLPNCTKKYDGIQAFVSKESAIYRCTEGRWTEYIKVYASEDDMPNCTEKRIGETAYVQKTAKTLICSKDKWNDWNGDNIDLPKSSTTEKSSSSKKTEKSSSSVAPSSSSSKKESSSSVVPSSSSKKIEPSSSSETPKSSSSKAIQSSSSKMVEPSYACAKAMWCGPRGDLQVNTGSEDPDHGWWFAYSDKINTNLVSGGNSKIIWPIEETGCDENGINCTDALNPIIRVKKAVEGRFILGTQLVYNDGTKINPYAVISFNTNNHYKDGMDITNWKGLCVTYTATDDIQLHLVPQNEATVDGYNHYRVSIPKASTTTTVNFLWSVFKQEENWGITKDLDDILKWVASIDLYYTAAPNSINAFKITTFGKYGTCGD